MRSTTIQLFATCFLALTTLSGCTADDAATPNELFVHFGTYTRGDSKGIYTYRMNLADGSLTEVGVAETVNPSFLAVHPGGDYLYAVGEISDFEGKKAGAISAFAHDRRTGKLTLLNQQPSGGGGPCHLVVDATGKHVLAANYGGGSVVSLPIKNDGSLGEATVVVQHEGSGVNPQRQKAPHAHSINLDKTNRYAFAADLGIDKVLIYEFDAATGMLKANDPTHGAVKPGAGPRHFAVHPTNRYAYVINEMQSTVTAFTFDAQGGALTEVQTLSTLPAPHQGNSTAEVQVHPSGRFLYGSNRGHNSIAIFSIDQKTGKLTAVGHESTRGEIPRNFGIDPTGQYLLAANQRTNNVTVFRIDQGTGKLTATGAELKVPSPVCVKFVAVAE